MTALVPQPPDAFGFRSNVQFRICFVTLELFSTRFCNPAGELIQLHHSNRIVNVPLPLNVKSSHSSMMTCDISNLPALVTLSATDQPTSLALRCMRRMIA